MASEMSPRGAVTTAIAALLVAVRYSITAGAPADHFLPSAFQVAEEIVAEGEKRYGKIPDDKS